MTDPNTRISPRLIHISMSIYQIKQIPKTLIYPNMLKSKKSPKMTSKTYT